jgi:uncharacterized protein (TIGR00255 family)
MTGFGKAVADSGSKKMIVEIKSLNAKSLDASLRLPPPYKAKELEVRAMLKRKLERGKIEFTLYGDGDDAGRDLPVDLPVVVAYYRQLVELSKTLGIEADRTALLQTALRLPDASLVKAEEPAEEEWQCIERAIEEAVEQLDRFRRDEGEALLDDILIHIGEIERLADGIPPLERQRAENVRQRLHDKVKEWAAVEVDKNRFEQELIYYIEKLDITEEKTRLAQHCRYFRDTAGGDDAPGRKLGFIAQEIGREINTIGSKANDCDIQKIVVRMKDELEKIKEQSLNLL